MFAYQRSGFLDDFITGTLSCCEITVDGEEMNHDEYSTISSFERGSVEQTAVELAKDVTQYYVSDTTTRIMLTVLLLIHTAIRSRNSAEQ